MRWADKRLISPRTLRINYTNPLAVIDLSTFFCYSCFTFLGILQSAVSHCEDQTVTESSTARTKAAATQRGEMAGMSAKMERVNGLLLLFQFVLLVSHSLATVSTTRDNCYNGPAPVIVNNEADVYLGTYNTYVWPCSGFRVANRTALTINHTVGHGANSQKGSDRNW